MCIHEWMLSEKNFGVCKLCGTEKDFAETHERRNVSGLNTPPYARRNLDPPRFMR